MTQRVARPMKFAAFISIIISVAVMLAACQGAVGKAGDKGEKGDTGDTGDSGTVGTPGISQLVALPAVPILIDDADDEGTDVVGAGPTGLSAVGYFRGGKAPVTYASARTKQATNVTADTASQAFNLTAASDGAITITKLAASAVGGTPEDHYMVGDMFTITATDADGVAESSNVTVRRNRAPAVGTLSGSLQGNNDSSPMTIGNQMGFAFGASEDDQSDPCNRLDTVCVTKADLMLSFTDTDNDEGTMFTPRDKNPDNVSSAIDSKGNLVITGKKLLLSGTMVQNARVFVKATDSNDLPSSAEIEIFVRVNPAITVAPGLLSSKTVKATNAAENLVVDIADFFSSKAADNSDETTLQVRLIEGDGTTVTDNADATVANTSFDVQINTEGVLMITPKNATTQGPVNVVVIARESDEATSQWVTHSIAITVTGA